jgi:hypothetical protein
VIVKDQFGFAGTYRNLWFDEWRTPGDAVALRARFAAQREFIVEKPMICTVSIVRGDAIKPVEGEMREVMNEAVKDTKDNIRATAIVIESTGFKAAVVRGIISALTLLSNAKYPAKTFATLDEAVAFLAPLLTPAASTDEVQAGYRALVDESRR